MIAPVYNSLIEQTEKRTVLDANGGSPHSRHCNGTTMILLAIIDATSADLMGPHGSSLYNITERLGTELFARAAMMGRE